MSEVHECQTMSPFTFGCKQVASRLVATVSPVAAGDPDAGETRLDGEPPDSAADALPAISVAPELRPVPARPVASAGGPPTGFRYSRPGTGPRRARGGPAHRGGG